MAPKNFLEILNLPIIISISARNSENQRYSSIIGKLGGFV